MKTSGLHKRSWFFVLLTLFMTAALSAQSSTQSADFHTSQLPSTGSVFAIDAGNPPLKIHASETKYNPHAAGNIARSFVYAGPQSSVEVEGAVSSIVLSSTTPTLYVRLVSDEPELARNRVSLVALGEDEKTRIIDFVSRDATALRIRMTVGTTYGYRAEATLLRVYRHIPGRAGL